MATLYIIMYFKIRQKVQKNFFLQIINGHGLFLARGWLRQCYLISRQKIINIMV